MLTPIHQKHLLFLGAPIISYISCQHNLELEVSKLKILEASHRSQKFALEDKISKTYPQAMQRLTEQIAGYKADMETAAKHPTSENHFPPMKIEGISYAEKKAAGSAILAACKNMMSSDPIELGEYRGFNITLSFNAFFKLYSLTLHGKITHSIELGNDIHGNITRIDNELERFGAWLKDSESKLTDTEKQLQIASEEVSRPFSQAVEYAEKSARLRKLDILLGMDERDTAIFDIEPDEGDFVPEQGTKTREYAMAR